MILNGKQVTVWCPKCDIEVHGHTAYATIDGGVHCDICKSECVDKEWLDKSKTVGYKLRKMLWIIFRR